MFTISKTFGFSAGHQLRGLAEGHPCMRPHGHNYTATFYLQSERLDNRGMVVDYGDLAPIRYHIDTVLDHQNLNTVLPQPTAEHLADYLLRLARTYFKQCFKVTVQETEKTSATAVYQEAQPAQIVAQSTTVIDHRPVDANPAVTNCPFGPECVACNPIPKA